VWIGPAQVAGRLVFAALGRRLSLQATGVLVFGAMPVALALAARADGPAGLYAFALLFGVSNGLVTILRGGLLPQVFGRAEIGRIGGAVTGVALVAFGGYPAVLIGLAGCAAAALLVYLAARGRGAPVQ
jgi:hypothetical protein